MTDHDPLCRQQHWDGGDCFDCRLIRKVRADERGVSEALADLRAKARLRAKVEALHAEALGWQKTREEKGYRESAQLFAVEAEAYADVLALIDGSDS